MQRTPVPDEDACWVCRRLHKQCHEECPHRLPPNDSKLIGSDGRPRNKYDLYVQLIHFKHGQNQLRKMGRPVLADIPMFSNAPPPPPPPPPQRQQPQQQQQRQQPPPNPLLSLPQFQSSPPKRKRNETANLGQSSLGLRPAKAKAVLDPVNEAVMPPPSVPGFNSSSTAGDQIVQRSNISDATISGGSQFVEQFDQLWSYPSLNPIYPDFNLKDAAWGSSEFDHQGLKMSDAVGGTGLGDHQELTMSDIFGGSSEFDHQGLKMSDVVGGTDVDISDYISPNQGGGANVG